MLQKHLALLLDKKCGAKDMVQLKLVQKRLRV